MQFKTLLLKIEELAETNDLSTPYIVGGVPRNIVLKKSIEFNDFDITTGDSTIHKLGELFAQHYKVEPKKMKDGHLQVIVDGIKFDFSSNFKYKHIDQILKESDVTEIDDLVRESYSRDFTINTFLMSMDLSQIIDITDRAFNDIHHKILSSPLNSTISFQHSPNRILRAFYYKARYGFNFSGELDQAIEENKDLLSKIHPRYAGEILNSILQADKNMIHELIERGILHKLPLTKYVVKILLENKRILEVI